MAAFGTPKNLAFKIVGGNGVDLVPGTNTENCKELDFQIACTTGTNTREVLFEGKNMNEANLELLKKDMQDTLKYIASKLNVPTPDLDTPSS